jgi:rSAM/selenodomain-associated transferase 1
MLDNALVIMARYPLPGGVKRRLAASLGDEGATALYRAFLEDWAAGKATDPRWHTYWAFTPSDAPFERDYARGRTAFAQRGSDLGERMRSALAEGIARGHRVVALVGADVPHLPAASIERAFAAVGGGADLALCPAADGGYVLIAARSVPDVFAGIVWGERDVLARTLSRARAAGLSVELLPALYDVDRLADAERLARDLESGRAADLPATRRALRIALSQRPPRL